MIGRIKPSNKIQENLKNRNIAAIFWRRRALVNRLDAGGQFLIESDQKKSKTVGPDSFYSGYYHDSEKNKLASFNM